MPSYKHLTKEERLDIDRYHQQGFSCSTISKLLGRSHTTISREIKRNNKDWKYGYVHDKAHKSAVSRAQKRTSILYKNQWLQHFIIEKLKLFWSPEMISLAI